MATLQQTMDDVSVQGNVYISSSVSTSPEESKLDRINFKESLRFFQEQLMNTSRKVSDLPNGNSLKCNTKINSKRNSIDSVDSVKDVDDSEDITVLYTNSKITPIPTVDTILESVRILRAIQKSQSQKGDSLWTLDIATSDTDTLESYKALELELQKSFNDINSLTSLTNQEDDSDQNTISLSDPLCLPNNNNAGYGDEENLETMTNDNSCSFWPKPVEMKEINKKDVLHASELQTDVNCNHLADLLITDTQSSPGDTSTDVRAYTTCDGEELELRKHYVMLPKNGVHEDLVGYSPSEDPEENVEDFLSCCSLSLHDDNSEPKLDLPHSERSTSTESDSGMGTDKSAGSLSPVRGEDVEKILWIESSSSEYASAECSPCASLMKTSEESAFATGSTANHFTNSELAALQEGDEMKSCIDANTSCDAEIKNMDIIPEENVSTDKPDIENEDIQRIPSSLSETDELPNQSVESELNNHNTNNSESHDCDMSRERLVEFVEDKIQQLELRTCDSAVIEKCLEHNGSTSDNEDNVLVHHVDVQETLQSDVNKVEETLRADDIIANNESTSVCQSHAESATVDETCQNAPGVETPVLNDDDNVINCYGETESEQNIQVPLETERSHEDLKHSISSTDGEIYVSSLECKLTNSESELRKINGNEDEEPVRSKKTVTVSWDPIPLVEHLYSKERRIIPEESVNKKEHLEGHLKIFPHGAFATIESSTFSTVEDSCIYFWETEEKSNLLASVPLQYASIESVDNTLIIDNRLGRNVKIKFETETELSKWKHALQAYCNPTKTFGFLEPVNYPLKSHKNVVIIDLGSCSTRAGILMDQPTLPNLFFPTVCATDKTTGKKLYGMEALMPEVRQNSNLTFPVRPSAKITKFTMDVEALEGLFSSIFSKLNINPKDYAVQISIPRSLSTTTQAALVKSLLENLGVKAVSLTRQALLTLYANNTSTAIVVDIGDRMDVLPVVDGFILECGVSRLPVGGQRIIHHMKHALAQKHISLSNDVESLVVQYIVENLCYVSDNYDEELRIAMSNPEVVRKSLPLYPFFKGDNILQTVTLDVGRFQVPEGLFNPDLWGVDFPGLHKLVHQAIQTSGMDVRRIMAENIYVSGGVTLIPGFVERLQKEVAKLTLPRLKPQVHASPYRYHMAYLGACKLAASEAFPQVCITSNEWQEKGPTSLNKWHL